MHSGTPVEVAPGVWWVGVRLPNDSFQCHAYYLENGDEGVLLDPGSPLTIDATLAKVEQITSLSSIRYLVCHHPDPDIAASLPHLSARLERDDVEVVTEWRAQALLKHYGHRFGYYRVEEHDWQVPLADGRRLEFQLTPYLHFPGAMVSYDTHTATLFSSDIFGGFVTKDAELESDDLEYLLEAARPFHQHYMPSSDLLRAGLARVRRRWPRIDRIAPQHGHVIPTACVDPMFEALSNIDCGVFTLADADVDLKHLLRISEARTRITEALLTVADPTPLVAALEEILNRTHEVRDCALFIDLPDQGWTMWGSGHHRPVRRTPPPAWPKITLPGTPAAVLAIHTADDVSPDPALMEMLAGLVPVVRPAIDQYLHDYRQSRRVTDLRRAAHTDPLTGLGNRRALDASVPVGDYAVISLDLDHFKQVNDLFGHAAGDSVLARVAGVLAGAIRDSDAAYRLGGEEFLLILRDAHADLAHLIADRIRTRVASLDLTGQAPDGRITVSMGLVTVTQGGAEAFPEALEAADAALYASKQSGRDALTVAARISGEEWGADSSSETAV